MRQKDKDIWEERTQKIAGELAAKAGVSAPTVQVVCSDDVQAKVGSGKIEIYTGLLDCVASGKISAGSLQAVIAHEIGHIKRGDDRELFRCKLMSAPLNPLKRFRLSAQQRLDDEEFAADKIAVDLTDGETVIVALQEMNDARKCVKGNWIARLSAPLKQCFDYEHPTTKERIEAIRKRTKP